MERVKAKDLKKMIRVIWARLTQCGFKDHINGHGQTSSGAALRLAQKLFVSEVCARRHEGWRLSTVDVKKAFLKGISYDELAEHMGQARREVDFELSEQAEAVLRTLPGYDDFDPRFEVLSMVRPGTGCKDAPRFGRFNSLGPTNSSGKLNLPHMMSICLSDIMAREAV